MEHTLENYFFNNHRRVIYKWHHYFPVYEQYFNRYKNTEIVVLEIGVSQGGSLQMWKDYFGSSAKIYGVDIDPRCKQFEEENIKIFIGSQSDKDFLEKIKAEMPPIDILIDDGGHTMVQQIATFKHLFSHIKDDGIYLCEDCHTSYWSNFGGGYLRSSSFIEYSKKWIDQLNAFHSTSKRLRPSSFTTSVKAIHYYDSIVVVEKMKRTLPVASKTGVATFPDQQERKTFKRNFSLLWKTSLNELLRKINLPFFFK